MSHVNPQIAMPPVNPNIAIPHVQTSLNGLVRFEFKKLKGVNLEINDHRGALWHTISVNGRIAFPDTDTPKWESYAWVNPAGDHQTPTISIRRAGGQEVDNMSLDRWIAVDPNLEYNVIFPTLSLHI